MLVPCSAFALVLRVVADVSGWLLLLLHFYCRRASSRSIRPRLAIWFVFGFDCLVLSIASLCCVVLLHPYTGRRSAHHAAVRRHIRDWRAHRVSRPSLPALASSFFRSIAVCTQGRVVLREAGLLCGPRGQAPRNVNLPDSKGEQALSPCCCLDPALSSDDTKCKSRYPKPHLSDTALQPLLRHCCSQHSQSVWCLRAWVAVCVRWLRLVRWRRSDWGALHAVARRSGAACFGCCFGGIRSWSLRV